LTLRIESGANMGEAKRRLREATDHISSVSTNKNVKVIVDIDPQ
jgi:hypothetical protein